MNKLNALQLTQELLRFNTINPPGNERPCAHHLGQLLEKAGYAVSYHEYADGRANLIARIGTGRERAPLCFTGHIDIVPLGTVTWKRDPFAGETDQGRVYGRGSSDMKAGVAAFVAAGITLAERLKPSPGVVFVITAGEETGCEGANYLEQQPGVLGKAGAIVVGEPTGNYPFIGHKGAYWLKATTRGVTAHGSMPELGDNAIYKLARAVAKLEHYNFDQPSHFMMGKPTLNVGTIHGGLNINSVPDQASAFLDMRTIPNQDHAKLREHMQRYLGADVELTPLMDVSSVWTEPSHPWMQQVFEISAKYLKDKPQPKTATYFTDAGALRRAYHGPPTVIYGPGEPSMAHQTDEYCDISKLEASVSAYADMMVRYCAI
jgi:succinyl-diaminopimelate desuccinylase